MDSPAVTAAALKPPLSPAQQAAPQQPSSLCAASKPSHYLSGGSKPLSSGLQSGVSTPAASLSSLTLLSDVSTGQVHPFAASKAAALLLTPSAISTITQPKLGGQLKQAAQPDDPGDGAAAHSLLRGGSCITAPAKGSSVQPHMVIGGGDCSRQLAKGAAGGAAAGLRRAGGADLFASLADTDEEDDEQDESIAYTGDMVL